ncbi:mevalonate kinase [Weissella diestrammenae]|uniref:Mevalonate kinase n=1 Tax=Weissella diestrammenae TaxID=1162633 RepID=A0A7G9T7P2_9LACO|nr:mevalonate kinase [Weissella diestrammenae]MCM0582079.1 mevalonate kinase [Weissella diestrammenae]QNN76117.1 mevalonate kinase [Weissella diestrammenae]
MKKTAIGKSHAKVILMGEHAVVYGQPAIALPLPNLTFTAQLTTRATGQLILAPAYQGYLSDMAENYEGLRQLITRLLDFFDANDIGFTLKITSLIPQERGMGSSAASAIAITRAFYDFFDAKLTNEALQNWAAIEEGITHGSPSGIDAATVASQVPVWFIKHSHPEAMAFNFDGILILADTGIHGQTGLAVSVVRNNLVNQPQSMQNHITDLGKLTLSAKDTLADDNIELLGTLMDDAHSHLRALGISHPKLELLVSAAKNAGAIGAKLTGGGIGGTMIALTDNQKTAKKIIAALETAGAKEIWMQNYQQHQE